ncbi:MAG TPA: glycosyltransferase family 39 protein [Bacteroidia bacterium]|nr:glycosyltransferase family 39 protein [Bacteroidia bacterium]
MKSLREHRLFVLVFLLCAILRFIPLFDYQFTLDELSGLCRTDFDSFSDLLEKGVKIDAHPALIQVMLFYLVKCFAYSTWIIKLPFLLFSLAALVYAYVFSLRNFSKQVALFSSVFLAFSLVFVFYAPVARMYITGVFFSIALLFHFYEIMFRGNRQTVHYAGIGLFALLSALNQHLNALFAFSVCASGLFLLKRQNTKAYLITCLITLLAYLPHLPITLYQLNVGGIGLEQGGWLEKPSWQSLLAFLKILFGTGYCFVVLAIAVLMKNLLDASTRIQTKHIYLLLVFLFNFVVIYMYSQLKSSIYQHSSMLFSGVAILFFTCALLDFSKRSWFITVFAILTVLLIYRTYWQKDYYKQCVHTVFEEQFRQSATCRKDLGEKSIYPVFLDADGFMEKVYAVKYKLNKPYVISSDDSKLSTEAFAQLVSGCERDYILLSSAMPLHEALTAEYFPFLVYSDITQANNIRLFSRLKKDSIHSFPSERVLNRFSLWEPGEFRFKVHAAEVKSRNAFRVDSLLEYPLELKVPYSKIFSAEGQVALLKVICKGKSGLARSMEACISVGDNIQHDNLQYSAGSGHILPMRADSTFVMYAQLYAGSKHAQLIEHNAEMAFYIWNRASERFDIRNMEISVIDHWPQKWHFWE